MTDDRDASLGLPIHSKDTVDHMSDSAAARLDELAGSLERAWRTGPEPNLDEYLRAEDVDRHPLLLELVRVDLEQRLRKGEPVRVEAYLSRYPELAVTPADVVDLVCWEYRVRRTLGQRVDIEEYQIRFPDQFAALRRRFREPAEVRQAPPSPPAAIRLNCPHCRNPIEIVAEQAEEMVCPSCGSSFRVDNDRTQTWSKDKLPKLGKFELLTRLGMGAFGTVYKAHDSELKRTVAIKLPRSGTIVDEEDEQRFLREARSAAQLHHPGIVPVFEVGRTDHFVYIVSELVEGITLADKLTAHRYTFPEAAELIARVAEAIDYSHRQGVIHRDLKPSNIMLTVDGTPRVMDFGLAKRDAGEVTMTVDGAVIGTPAYMSPEQAAGHGHEVDGRSDVYSLGVILYQLLTGEAPFRGNQRMLLHQVMNDEPRAPRSLNDRIPRDLDTICLKCLSKERHRRYETASELADELRRFLQGEPIVARPISTTERAWRWCQRNPLIAVLSSAVVLLFMAGTTISMYFAIEANRRADAEMKARLAGIQDRDRAERERNLATEQSRRAFRQHYVTQMNMAVRDWEIGDVKQLRSRLRQTQPARTGGRDRRGFEWYYWDRLVKNELYSIKGSADPVAFSPCGRWFASIGHYDREEDQKEDVTIRDTRSGQVLHTLKGTSWPIVLSPNGKLLVCGSDTGNKRLWDTNSGQPVLALDQKLHQSVAFSPNGNLIASVDTAVASESIKIWDAAHGHLTMTLRTDLPGSVTFSPDGKSIMSRHADDTNVVWDIHDGQRLWTIKHEGCYRMSDTSVDFSPNGQRIASIGDRTIKVWSSRNGQEVASIPRHYVDRIVWSPDCHTIVARDTSDETVFEWDARDGHIIRSWKSAPGFTTSLWISPDGRLIGLATDQAIEIWKKTEKGTNRVFKLRGHSKGVRVGRGLLEGDKLPNSVTLSPDGQRLAIQLDNKLSIWNEFELVDGYQTFVRDITPDARISYLPKELTDPFESLRTTGSEYDAYSPDGRLHATHASNVEVTTIEDLKTSSEVGASRDAFANAIKTVWSSVWNSQAFDERQEIAVLKGQPDIDFLVFSPDSRHLVSAGSDHTKKELRRYTVKMYEAYTGRELRTITTEKDRINFVAFSPDGGRIATAHADNAVKVWNTASGDQLHQLHGHTGSVLSVDYSHDGLRIASSSADDAIKIWDAECGAEIFTLNGHASDVVLVDFGPDGFRLASASDEGTVKLWELESGQEVLSLDAAPPNQSGRHIFASGLAFDRDGRRIALESTHGFKVWDAREWNPELRAESEALIYIKLRFERGVSVDEIRKEVTTSLDVSEAVRQRCVELLTSGK